MIFHFLASKMLTEEKVPGDNLIFSYSLDFLSLSGVKLQKSNSPLSSNCLLLE